MAVLLKANSTKLRATPHKFEPIIERRHYPAAYELPPPGFTSHHANDQELFGLTTHMWAKNGVLETRLGRLICRAYAARLGARGLEVTRSAPKIGSTIKGWATPDGCKCFAFSHNWFPKYVNYVDGVRIDPTMWPNFKRFDGYQIGVESRLLFAFLLHESLQYQPLLGRYPGTAGLGWYREASDHDIIWCDDRSPPYYIEFGPRPSDEGVVAWWEALDRFVRQIRSQFARREHGSFADWWPSVLEEVTSLWEQVDLNQQRWRVWSRVEE